MEFVQNLNFKTQKFCLGLGFEFEFGPQIIRDLVRGKIYVYRWHFRYHLPTYLVEECPLKVGLEKQLEFTDWNTSSH